MLYARGRVHNHRNRDLRGSSSTTSTTSTTTTSTTTVVTTTTEGTSAVSTTPAGETSTCGGVTVPPGSQCGTSSEGRAELVTIGYWIGAIVLFALTPVVPVAPIPAAILLEAATESTIYDTQEGGRATPKGAAEAPGTELAQQIVEGAQTVCELTGWC